MKIHFYINTSFPHGMAASKRLQCYAKGLKATGNVVDVVVCLKTYNPGEADELPAKGIHKGIPYEYVCGTTRHARWNKLLRGLDYNVLDYVHSFFYALRHIKRGDIVFSYYYNLLLQILILLAAKLKGAKIVKETCEHPTALKKCSEPIRKLSDWFEFKLIMPRYDGFIAISRALEKFVEQYKSARASSIIVPILVDNEYDNKEYDEEERPYPVPYIIHTGTMVEPKDSISKILKGFARFKKETGSNCKLVFTGPQANKKCRYLPLIAELGIEQDVELVGLVSPDEVARLQHFAAMTIIYKSDNLQTRNCFPTKLGEMLLSGIPVITTTIGDANLYLENEVSAYIVTPDDEDTLVKYMREISDDPDNAKRISLAGKLVAQKAFNPLYQGKRISDFFTVILNH